jgi:magnesium chelatase family protein
MVAKIKTFCFSGVNVVDVEAEVKISSGMPVFSIVGLGDKAVSESKERIRAAISSIGLEIPAKRIIVNLSPADLNKEGSHYDLPIALGILSELGIVDKDRLLNYYCLGELSLDGSINKISGILPSAVGANTRKSGIICPADCGSEALWASESLPIIAAKNLIELINHLKNLSKIPKPKLNPIRQDYSYPDLRDVKGNKVAKRALEITAAGGHNMLMVGPPGSGKSMLAARIQGILPEPSLDEILETNIIHSISGKIIDNNLITKRPFVAPHHSCSMPAMVGGGTKPKPGEISLAHNGILFLDELAEFPRSVLESLRQPIENGKITVSRAQSHVDYPANFQIIAAMNPCRCGYLSDKERECSRAPKCGIDYQAKISGPLLDRMDIIINVAQIDIFADHEKESLEYSSSIKKRVIDARNIQKQRYKNAKVSQNNKTNARISGKIFEEAVTIDEETKNIAKLSINKLKLSMRGYGKILKVARTIADLAGSKNILKEHLLEAISYRRNLT